MEPAMALCAGVATLTLMLGVVGLLPAAVRWLADTNVQLSPRPVAAFLMVASFVPVLVRSNPRCLEHLPGLLPAAWTEAAPGILALEPGETYDMDGREVQVLDAAGIRTPHHYRGTTAAHVVEAAETIGYPIVMKVVSRDILHKSDAKGVKLDLSGKNQVKAAFTEIIDNAKAYKADARIEGVLISPMVGKGIEVIIGTKIDDQFGPVIMYGLGGVMVEINA